VISSIGCRCSSASLASSALWHSNAFTVLLLPTCLGCVPVLQRFQHVRDSDLQHLDIYSNLALKCLLWPAWFLLSLSCCVEHSCTNPHCQRFIRSWLSRNSSRLSYFSGVAVEHCAYVTILLPQYLFIIIVTTVGSFFSS
jgi:hypothetical protein